MSPVRQCGEDLTDLATLSKLIERIGEDHKTFILLIYHEDLQEKANMIKYYLTDIADGIK